MKYIPSSEKMDLNEYYGEMADGEIALVIGTEKLEERGLLDGNKADSNTIAIDTSAHRKVFHIVILSMMYQYYQLYRQLDDTGLSIP